MAHFTGSAELCGLIWSWWYLLAGLFRRPRHSLEVGRVLPYWLDFMRFCVGGRVSAVRAGTPRVRRGSLDSMGVGTAPCGPMGVVSCCWCSTMVAWGSQSPLAAVGCAGGAGGPRGPQDSLRVGGVGGSTAPGAARWVVGGAHWGLATYTTSTDGLHSQTVYPHGQSTVDGSQWDPMVLVDVNGLCWNMRTPRLSLRPYQVGKTSWVSAGSVELCVAPWGWRVSTGVGRTLW